MRAELMQKHQRKMQEIKNRTPSLPPEAANVLADTTNKPSE